MLLMTSRIPYNIQKPFRSIRPQTSKIIFLSFEGSVTEEEYFYRVSEIFDEIKSKIQFISVAEDAVHTAPKCRTTDQSRMLSESRPKQLVEKIDWFKKEKNDIYQFSKYPDDEFWIVTDVDQNWSDQIIDAQKGTTYKEEWNEVITECQEKGYNYAISNPFFEVWLLLHHDDPSEKDKSFGVSDEHPYEKTDHFRKRLCNLEVPLKNKKHINPSDYDCNKIKIAVHRAKELHIDKQDLCPKYFATTVYLLLEKIFAMLPENPSEKYDDE